MIGSNEQESQQKNSWNTFKPTPKGFVHLGLVGRSQEVLLALMWLVLLLHLFCPFIYFPSPKPFDGEERQPPQSVSGHREKEVWDWEWAQFCPLQAGVLLAATVGWGCPCGRKSSQPFTAPATVENITWKIFLSLCHLGYVLHIHHLCIFSTLISPICIYTGPNDNNYHKTIALSPYQ